jgi:hypothetical protein
MKLTTLETNALIARLETLSTAITAVTDLINPADVPTDHVECGTELTALDTAMRDVQDNLPTASSGGPGAASTTVAGAAAFRAKVDAGYDES